MKVVIVDPRKCTGCRLCEVACSLRATGECNPTRARIHVIGFDEAFCLPVTCFHCEIPYCSKVCPTGAISKGKVGAVKVSRQKCIGCRVCVLACPFGNIAFSSAEKIVAKCELCDGEPECVLFCPTRALEFREADTDMIHKKITFLEKLKEIYK